MRARAVEFHDSIPFSGRVMRAEDVYAERCDQDQVSRLCLVEEDDFLIRPESGLPPALVTRIRKPVAKSQVDVLLDGTRFPEPGFPDAP